MDKQILIECLRKAYEDAENGFICKYHPQGICAAAREHYPGHALDMCLAISEILYEMSGERKSAYYWPLGDWEPRKWAILLMIHWLEDKQ